MLYLEFASGLEDARTSLGAESLQQARQRLATTVAGQIALSLSSLRLRETLRDQSIRDPLTGLFNRRFMEESLEREMQRAVRKNHPVSVLFVDLDHFKRFNDTFGHDAGDFVLRSIADCVPQGFPGGRCDLPLWRGGIRHYPARVFVGECRHPCQCAARGHKEDGYAVQEPRSGNDHTVRRRGHAFPSMGRPRKSC